VLKVVIADRLCSRLTTNAGLITSRLVKTDDGRCFIQALSYRPASYQLQSPQPNFCRLRRVLDNGTGAEVRAIVFGFHR